MTSVATEVTKQTLPVQCKVLLLGESSVGKSSLVVRFADTTWLHGEMRPTVGVDFRLHYMDVNGRQIKLNVWDTAGQERFRAMISSYYRGAQGIILVYDICRRETFDALARWYSELDRYLSSSVVKIIVGNKVDMESSRQVSTIEGQAFALRMNSLFVEASARTDVGVCAVFDKLVAQMLVTPDLWAPTTMLPRRQKISPSPSNRNAVVRLKDADPMRMRGRAPITEIHSDLHLLITI